MTEGISGVKQQWRPAFHFTAPRGWINDPNGLIHYNGVYHLFYQHNPYGTEWGSMHWGHAVSRDLFTWEDLPIALKPDQDYDAYSKGGCFSGSAIEKDGILYLYYTGVTEKDGIVQSQNMASSGDGITFVKYAGNPLIPACPEGEGSRDFRDPKVFYHRDRWYMVAGTCVRKEGGSDGRVLLYESPDLRRWQYKSRLFCSNGRYGTMAECPDLFPLDDAWVLMFSPMNTLLGGKSLYFVGDVDFESGVFIPEDEGEVDSGFDYYAPQSFKDEAGRRVLVAWMSSWDFMPWFRGFGPAAQEGWRGVLSTPRYCFFNAAKKLCFLPAPRIEALRRETGIHAGVTIRPEPVFFDPVPANQYELLISGNAASMDSRYFELGLFLAPGSRDGAVLARVSLVHRTLEVSLRGEDCMPAFCPLELDGGRLELRIIVDRSTLEIFADGGRRCMSFAVFPAPSETAFFLRTPRKDAVLENLTVFGLEGTMNRGGAP